MTEPFIMTPDGAEPLAFPSGAPAAQTAGAIDDAGQLLAQLDAAVARSDWASVVKLEPQVGTAIDAAAEPAYGSNVPQAAALAGKAQGNTQAAWATNTALAAQVAAGAAQSEMVASSGMISSYLHQAFSETQQALSALGGGTPSWLPWAGLGALCGLVLLIVAKLRSGVSERAASHHEEVP